MFVGFASRLQCLLVAWYPPRVLGCILLLGGTLLYFLDPERAATHCTWRLSTGRWCCLPEVVVVLKQVRDFLGSAWSTLPWRSVLTSGLLGVPFLKVICSYNSGAGASLVQLVLFSSAEEACDVNPSPLGGQTLWGFFRVVGFRITYFLLVRIKSA